MPFSIATQTFLLAAAAVEAFRTPADCLLLEVAAAEGSSPARPWRRADSIRVLAVGAFSDVRRHPEASRATVIDLPDHVVMPGLVNAHAHLDLTHIGPRGYDGAAGFRGFVETVRRERHTEDVRIADSVREGIRLSLAGGVVAVGDIAGCPRTGPSLEPWRTLRDSPLRGISFLEYFAIGNAEARGLANARRAVDAWRRESASQSPDPGRANRVRFGIQPHATNTVSLRAYLEDFGTSDNGGPFPLCTHVAETPEERRFIAEAAGPQRAMLEELGIWDDAMLSEIGHGATPVRHLNRVLREKRPLAVHINGASDDDLALLRDAGVSVVYCPRASEYFNAAASFGPHRYREMIARGIPVALGTDSVVNLPREVCGSEAGDAARISVLDEMRLLFQRDRTDPRTLLRMGTIDGARALGMDAEGFMLAVGARPVGVVAVPIERGEGSALERVMTGSAPPRLLFLCT